MVPLSLFSLSLFSLSSLLFQTILVKAPAAPARRVLPRLRLEPRDDELRRLDEPLGALGHARLLPRRERAAGRAREARVPADVGDAGDGLLDL